MMRSKLLSAGALALVLTTAVPAPALAGGRYHRGHHGHHHGNGAAVAGAIIGGALLGGVLLHHLLPPPVPVYRRPVVREDPYDYGYEEGYGLGVDRGRYNRYEDGYREGYEEGVRAGRGGY